LNSHAKRLNLAIAEIRARGNFTRLEPASILVEARRLLEDTSLQKSFPAIMLYADWCAHPRLDRIGAGTVLLQIAEALNRDIRNSASASVDALYGAVGSALALRKLHQELASLFERFQVDTTTLEDAQMFRQFIGALLDTIAELPLAFPQDIAQSTGKIRKLYDAACLAARNDPQWIVIHCSVTNALSDEQLVFYAVPKGTYLWQIGTAAGVFFCGVL
jgi:hypothetical protein